MFKYYIISISIQLLSIFCIQWIQEIADYLDPNHYDVQVRSHKERQYKLNMQNLNLKRVAVSFDSDDFIIQQQNSAKSLSSKEARVNIIQQQINQYLLDIKYPVLAKKMGMQGTVLVRIYIDEDGKLSRYEVAKTSGFKLLDSAALQGISKWSFSDGTAEVILVPVVFRLV